MKPAPEPAAVAILRFTRVLEAPVHSFALDETPKVVALGEQPWLSDDGEKFAAIPLGDRLAPAAGESDRAHVFFGRDNRPRMMGTRSGADGGTEQIYLRYKNGRWQAEPKEIGHLANQPGAALFGWLGHPDPELVCKLGGICLIKSRKGWKMMDAGDEEPAASVYSGGTVWGLFPDRIGAIDDDHWRWYRDLPFSKPSGLYAHAGEVKWVSVATETALYAYAGEWKRHPSPLAAPRGMWGSAPDDVWLVGDDGVAHFDGERWQRAEGPRGPLTMVAGRGRDDVWVGGRAGLFRGRPR